MAAQKLVKKSITFECLVPNSMSPYLVPPDTQPSEECPSWNPYKVLRQAVRQFYKQLSVGMISPTFEHFQ